MGGCRPTGPWHDRRPQVAPMIQGVVVDGDRSGDHGSLTEAGTVYQEGLYNACVERERP